MESWFLLALLSAFCLGGYDLCKKHAVQNNVVLPVLFASTVSGLVCLILWTLLDGSFVPSLHCTASQYGVIWLKSLIVGGSWVCAYYALVTMPISIAAPIRASAPCIVLLGGIFLYHEIPTVGDAVGIVLVFAGYYGFSVMGRKEGFSFSHSRGMQLVFLGTFLGAMSAIWDKYLLNTLQIPPKTVQLYFSLDLVILFLLAILLQLCLGRRKELAAVQWRWTAFLTGILLILADYVYFRSVSVPGAPISQISLVRRVSCVITFFLGAWIFRDRNLKGKTVALILILAGVVLLGLF